MKRPRHAFHYVLGDPSDVQRCRRPGCLVQNKADKMFRVGGSGPWSTTRPICTSGETESDSAASPNAEGL